MNTVDVPQANDLSTVRQVVAAVASGAFDLKAVAGWTTFSRRHTQYRVHAARILALVTMDDLGVLALTAMGQRLLDTAPDSESERVAFGDAILHSPTMRRLAPKLLDPEPPTQDEIAQNLVKQAHLGAATARRRAGGLLTWRRRVLNEPYPIPGQLDEEEEGVDGKPTRQLSLFE